MGMYENGKQYADEQLAIDGRGGETVQEKRDAIRAGFQEELEHALERVAQATSEGSRGRWQDQIDFLRGGLARLDEVERASDA